MYLCGPFVNFCWLFDFYLCTLSGYHRISQSTQTDVTTQPTLSGHRNCEWSVWLKCGHNDNWGLPPQARSEIIVNTNATTGILYSNHPAQTGDLLGLECNLVKVYRWSKGPTLPRNSRKENTCLITWIILPSTNICTRRQAPIYLGQCSLTDVIWAQAVQADGCRPKLFELFLSNTSHHTGTNRLLMWWRHNDIYSMLHSPPRVPDIHIIVSLNHTHPNLTRLNISVKWSRDCRKYTSDITSWHILKDRMSQAHGCGVTCYKILQHHKFQNNLYLLAQILEDQWTNCLDRSGEG